MFAVLAGALLIYISMNYIAEVEELPRDYVYYEHPTPAGPVAERGLTVTPDKVARYHGIVTQAYDYSCGSAALTTVLNGYLGRQFEERQIMEGLLRFGEYDKIVERRGFSLLDMKRLTTALGHPSGGFRASMDDLRELDHPAVIPIGYAGFKHFVVLKGIRNGRVFVADPALGNISFTEQRFEEIWPEKVLFIVFPNGFEPQPGLEIADRDLRFIDDQTLRRLSFRQPETYTIAVENSADRAGTLVPVEIINNDGKLEIVNIPLRTYLND